MKSPSRFSTSAEAARERCLNAGEVTRYVATYVKADGVRTLMSPAQGRFTYATPAEAQVWIDAVIENNSPATIRQVWGENPRFEVRPCACWPGHFDPKGVWFDVPDISKLSDRELSNVLHGRAADDNGEFTASSMGAAQDALKVKR